MANDVKIGIIGGSGLIRWRDSSKSKNRPSIRLGKPSDAYRIGTLEGQRVAFLARHNRNHTILPSELNFRANIYGFKKLGVEWILSASAVGSLKEEFRLLDIVLPDQFYDRTKGRISTFFGKGIVAMSALPILSVQLRMWSRGSADAGVAVKAGRNLRLHGGSSVFDEGGIEYLSEAGEWI